MNVNLIIVMIFTQLYCERTNKLNYFKICNLQKGRFYQSLNEEGGIGPREPERCKGQKVAGYLSDRRGASWFGE